MNGALNDIIHQDLFITSDLKWRFFPIFFKYRIERIFKSLDEYIVGGMDAAVVHMCLNLNHAVDL